MVEESESRSFSIYSNLLSSLLYITSKEIVKSCNKELSQKTTINATMTQHTQENENSIPRIDGTPLTAAGYQQAALVLDYNPGAQKYARILVKAIGQKEKSIPTFEHQQAKRPMKGKRQEDLMAKIL
jgi:predicted methyltransferase